MEIIFEDNIKKVLLRETTPGTVVEDENGTIYIVVNDMYKNIKDDSKISILDNSKTVAAVRVWDGSLFMLGDDMVVTPCEFIEIKLRREMD